MNPEHTTPPIEEQDQQLAQSLQAMYADEIIDWVHTIASYEQQAAEDEQLIKEARDIERKTATFWWIFLACISAAALLICYIHHHL